MAIVLDATVGGASSNSYIDQATADAILETRSHVFAVWSALSSGQKDAALISASGLLDTLEWKGVRTDELQALRWPRSGVYDRDGYLYADDAIPRVVQEVLADYAYQVSQSNPFAETGLEGFSEIQVDVIKLKLDKADRPDAFPSRLMDRIAHLLARGRGSASVPVVRT